MKVKIRNVLSKQDEQVVIECVEMTPELEDIKNYCLAKGAFLTGYINASSQQQICIKDILYVEAIDEKVFAYTKENVFEIRQRLYELETELAPYKFIRCSKSFLICLLKVESIRPALNGRYLACMENGEEVIISRKYAKHVKKTIMEEL
ncbi:MAG: LytTR family transcriptional regulator [Lachnospiraceae bacterium]|nr:LytTR family transcriptional regulator [Lachnospiraceae bacterium]